MNKFRVLCAVSFTLALFCSWQGMAILDYAINEQVTWWLWQPEIESTPNSTARWSAGNHPLVYRQMWTPNAVFYHFVVHPLYFGESGGGEWGVFVARMLVADSIVFFSLSGALAWKANK